MDLYLNHSFLRLRFATILAVVAGLVFSGASAIAHDLYGQVIKKGNVTEQQQVRAARMAALSISIILNHYFNLC